MSEWKEYKLGDLCEVGRGSSPRPIIDQKYFINGRIPWIKIADATASGKYIQSTKEYVNEYGASFSRYLDENSLIIAASGVSLGQIKFLGVKGCIHDGWLYTSKYKEDKLNKDFLYYFLIYYSESFHNFSSGAAIQNINTEILRNTKINLPSLKTQQKIANILSTYDELIEVNTLRIKTLEETAQALYKEWFVRFRFPNYQQTEFIKGVPKGWEVGNIFDFAEVKGGGTPLTTNEQYWTGNIPFYTPTDYNNDFYVFETEKNITKLGLKNSSTKLFSKGTVFITARGSVGNVCLAGIDMAMNQSCFAIVSSNNTNEFYLFLFVKEMTNFFKQVASGATFDAFNLATFKNYKTIIPNVDVIESFSIICTPIFNQIETLQSQNKELRQIRDRLLPRLISGRISV